MLNLKNLITLTLSLFLALPVWAQSGSFYTMATKVANSENMGYVFLEYVSRLNEISLDEIRDQLVNHPEQFKKNAFNACSLRSRVDGESGDVGISHAGIACVSLMTEGQKGEVSRSDVEGSLKTAILRQYMQDRYGPDEDLYD